MQGVTGATAVPNTDAMSSDMLRAAAEQFVPAAVAGVLVTLVLTQTAEATLWMLPGLWQILISLGVFASCRSLPRPMIAVAIWYLGCGLACLVLAVGEHALSPLAMGVPFFVGQMLSALIINRSFGGGHGEA